MLIDQILKTQEEDQSATLYLVEKFNPLLMKYAFKLHSEDAYNDLLLDFIELIHNIRLEQIHYKDDGHIVSYIRTSIHSSYIKRLIAIKKLHGIVHYSELSDSEVYYLDLLTSIKDEYFKYDFPVDSKILSEAEMQVIKMIYYSGYTVSEIAFICGVSRQAVNQMKKRAFKKLVKMIAN